MFTITVAIFADKQYHPILLSEHTSSHDIDRLRTHVHENPNLSQDGLNKCLVLAMPKAPLDMIRLLLDKGAKLTAIAFHRLVERQESALLQMLVDYGWGINSTEFELPAVQYV